MCITVMLLILSLPVLAGAITILLFVEKCSVGMTASY